MERILSHTPQHSNGVLTIVTLAQEAQVPRNALTQRHLDLNNEFYERVKERGAAPDAEARLRTTIVKLKRTIASKNEELDRFRADVPALVCVVNQLTLENQQLREQLDLAAANVIPLPGRRT